MRRSLYVLTLMTAFCGMSRTDAAMITVLNPGFEDLVLPGAGSASNFVLGNIPNWVVNASLQTATWKPGASSFPGGVPEGVNVAAVGNTSSGVIHQSLAAQLQADTTYTLMVDVGHRLDFETGIYLIELYAGSTLLASSSSLDPVDGTFLTDTLVYSSGASPTGLGESLLIRLSATNAGRGQVDFDNVRLDATPTGASEIPEPSSLLMATFGLAGLGLFSRTRRFRWRLVAAT